MRSMFRKSVLPILGTALSLLLLCSCATPRQSHLPPPLTFNKDAGRGDLLYVPIRLETGEELLFAVDTGAPATLFDQSVEPKLGKRLASIKVHRWGKIQEGGIYLSPKLYLGGTPLKMTGEQVLTADLSDLPDMHNRPLRGVLGMDVLEHYCIQLDFQSRKLRFLATNQLDPGALGKAFPLTYVMQGGSGCPYIHHPPLLGEHTTNVLIDLGFNQDGALSPALFRKLFTQPTASPPGRTNDIQSLHDQKCLWNGHSYTNLTIVEQANLLGLRFLARHLVTFDFPNRVMYLKQTSTGPLVDRQFQATFDRMGESALKSLWRLQKKGQLPGWGKDDQLSTDEVTLHINYPDSVICLLQKKGDASIYHYEFFRPAKDSLWKLRKAWRTTPNAPSTEEYPVHL